MDYKLLVEKYQQGNEEALQTLIKEFHPTLLRTLYHYTNDKTPVDDLAQECWYTIVDQLAEVDLYISFKAWALTIARRRAIDWIRSQQRSRRKAKALKKHVKEKNHQPNTALEDGRLEKVRIGIQQISPSHRVVLRMFYMENLSLEEISTVLEISKGTVKSRLFYAREKLKNTINP
jgi:RNA polymerase sigma-70 factor (ECF subfamily)